jgi:cellulose synthase/poly-beta-1,6-N-acetylglucosamine synthase-like glycosyltransferase
MGNIVKLSLVTFVSGVEVLTDDFLSLANNLQQLYNIEVIAVVNQINNIDTSQYIKQVVSPFTTKYNRIQQLLIETKMDYCLFIDNDITPDSNEIIKFLQESFASEADLAWGQIGVRPSSLMAKMIKIDKILSHSIIRPLLWRLGLGASIPGQIFLTKSQSFRKKLPKTDTIFDDLTIGIYAKENNFSVYFKRSILGFEKPKDNILSLLNQRIRWANGFAQVVNINRRNSSSLNLVLIHGAAYHFLLLLFWLLFFGLSFVSIKYSLILWLILISILTFGQVSLIAASLVYTIVFPIVHVVWLGVAVPRCFKWVG